MELYKDLEILKVKYKLYASDMLNSIAFVKDDSEIGDDIKLKIQHGLSMCDLVRTATINSGFFNSTYEQSAAVEGLLHDIGRFEQYLVSGTLSDEKSKKYTKYDDHGQYGKHILSRKNNELLRYFLPIKTKYDYILKEVIGQHTTISNPNYIFPIKELENLFMDYELIEVLNSNDEQIKNKLIALKLLILKEEDSMEILHKVRDGLWKPAIGAEEKYHIKDEVWKLFLNMENLNMQDLKQKGLWSCNSGFLLRYSLIYNNINFVGTLKALLQDGTIDKVYQNQINNVTNDQNEVVTDEKFIDPRLKEAYEYMQEVVKELINTSPDGRIITNESRQVAHQKLKKIM